MGYRSYWVGSLLGFRVYTWTPKVCSVMASMAAIILFYLFWGSIGFRVGSLLGGTAIRTI